MAVSQPSNEESIQLPGPEARAGRAIPNLAGTLWEWLNQRWLLLVPGGLALLLVLGGLLLPQMPGQLNDEPAAAARWLLTTSSSYGAVGGLLRALGLFNVLHSPLLRFLLALVGLILAAQLGTWLGYALLLYRIRRNPEQLLTQPAPAWAEPLSLQAGIPLYRLRQALPLPPKETVEALRAWLGQRFQQVAEGTAPLPPEAPEAELPEVRFWATRDAPFAYLRPALLAGLLLALLAMWSVVTLGWQMAPPTLAPGETYRYALRNVELSYPVPPVEETSSQALPAPVLEARVGEHRASATVTARTRLRLGPVDVIARPGPLGVLVATADGSPAIARPGQGRPAATVGLLFPGPGSEESLVLPEAGLGLRLVRRAPQTSAGAPEPSEQFLVEVYSGNSVEPRERLELSGREAQEIRLGPDGPRLRWVPMPGLQVEIRRMPGVWLLWPALFLALAGAVGFWRRPTWLLVQVAPWPQEHTLVIAQSDRQATLAELEAWQEEEQEAEEEAAADADAEDDDDGTEEGAPAAAARGAHAAKGASSSSQE